MSKREAELKAGFTAEMKRILPHYVILLQSTRGAPDRSISGDGRTTWWEFKHATPDFDSPGIQELTCMRLDVASYCRYVLWWENKRRDIRRTLIVRPIDLHERNGWDVVAETCCEGFDHTWLVDYIERTHQQ